MAQFFYGADSEGLSGNSFSRIGDAKNAFILMLIEPITKGNRAILDHSKGFLPIQNTERDKPCS